jgi:hypothetical protein
MSGVVSGLAQLLMGVATVPSWFSWASFGPIRPGACGRATGHVWSTYVLTVCLAALRGRLPLRTMAFRTDVHRIGILIPVGARHEFRHPALRRVLRDPSAEPGTSARSAS